MLKIKFFKLRIKLTPSQVLVHLLAWGLVAWLAWDAWTGNLTVNPIQAAEQRTGKYALVLLVLSLACTPLNTLFGLRQAITVRRTLGLYAFLFAAAHFLIFIGIDYGFSLEFLIPDIRNKLYIFVGLTALVMLTLLAATSFKWWMKRLGKRWKALHRLIYLAAPLVVLHYAWARKGDIFRLQGDIVQPLAFGIVVGLLLLARLPALRRGAVRLRGQLQRRLAIATTTTKVSIPREKV
jgi:methionine sulfoxide reductase heme-binding subunit